MKAILAVVAVLLAVTHVGDTHNVTITESTYNVREGSCIDVTVQTTLVHDFNSTVFLIIADGGEDFEVANTTVNFPARENVSLVSLCAKDDEIVELPENFILYIQVEHEAIHHGVTISLEDNDSGTVSFSPQNYSIPEGTDAELTIVLDKAFAINLTFNVTTKDDTATSPDDYTGGHYSVTIPALKKEGKVSVLTAKNETLEPDEHFIATLHVPEHPKLSTGLTTAVITINDRTIPVVFEHAIYNVTEGPGVKAITITLKTVVQRDYPFAVEVSTQSGSAGDNDFQDKTVLVRFPDQAKEANFTVTIFDDDIAECCEEFFPELRIPSDAGRMGVIKGDLSNAKVIINDTDFAEINFKDQTYWVGEGETVNLTIEVDKDFSCVFCIQTIDVTATAGEDYVSVNKCFTFDPNTTIATYPVETMNDATPETNECFNVTIYVLEDPCASNVILGNKTTATVCLCDSSRATIRFKNASLNVSEGMQARLVVVLDERAERDIEFTVTTRDGTADSHGKIDYFSINKTSTIPAGTLEESVIVKTQKNRLIDPPEYFFADLIVSGECKNVDLGTKTANITIVDISVLVSLGNDSNETVTYNVVKEDVNHTCVTLKAVGPSIETAFDVIVVATDGSATYPSDYAAREATATFLRGETTANACIPIVDDEDHECLEWFTLELKLTQAASDLCAALSSPATARVLIEDNDVVGIDFDPQTYNITEGDLGELSFSLNRTSQTNISFIAMTMNRTADGSDYVGGNFPQKADVEVVTERAEVCSRDPNHTGAYDWVFTRYVATLRDSAAYCMPFLKATGKWVAYKSGKEIIDTEINESATALNALGGGVETVFTTPKFNRSYVVIRRVRA